MKLDTIADRIEHVRWLISAACLRRGRPPDDVTLVAATKGVSPQAIMEAVAVGVRHLGENRVQEARAKRPALADLPSDVVWHMIGHLQGNKVKTAVGLFDIIHSVDSVHLAAAISRRALRTAAAFLEVNVSGEPSKYGFSVEELPRSCESIRRLPNIDVRGLMTVAPATDDPQMVRPVFHRLREAADALGLRELSMGMTDDFEMAIEEGATHIRIGRAIFGERR